MRRRTPAPPADTRTEAEKAADALERCWGRPPEGTRTPVEVAIERVLDPPWPEPDPNQPCLRYRHMPYDLILPYWLELWVAGRVVFFSTGETRFGWSYTALAEGLCRWVASEGRVWNDEMMRWDDETMRWEEDS